MKKYIFSFLVAGTLVLSGCTDDNQGDQLQGDSASKKEAQVTEEESYEKVDPKQDEKLLNSQEIYYETPKQKTPPVHKDAEKVIENVAKKKKVNVKPNLNDARYRDFVYNVATDVSSLPKDDQKKVVELAKYIDRYENELKNKRIKELKAKVAAGKKLTGKERAELDSLLPIKPGKKIDYQDRPTEDQLVKQQPNNQGTQPDQGGNQGNDNQATNPNNNNDQGDNQGNQNQGDHDGRHGGSDRGSRSGQDDGSRSNDNGNDQGGQNDRGSSGRQGGNQGGQQGNNGTNPNQGSNQGGNNVGGNGTGGQLPIRTGSYDPIKARDYAYKWWNKRNNEQYGYYSRVSGGCYDCWYDCTNFVSQAIKEGGIKEQRTGGTYWYYSDEKPAYAWGVANSFYKHFKTRAKEVRRLFDLEVGDVVNADFDHDGDIEHSAIVTKVTPTEVYVTQHTTDRKDAPLSYWFNAGYSVYGWKMQTANGD